MNIAIWIIAIVEVIRMLQNCIQIMQIKKANSNPQFERATDEFIKSLKKTDEEFVEDMLEQLKSSRKAYQKGATDMEKAKQIVIDMLLNQIKNITDSLPTCDRYNDYGCPNSVDDCFDCMANSIDKIKENLGLEEQK